MNVAERLRALADGKKIRAASWPSGYRVWIKPGRGLVGYTLTAYQDAMKHIALDDEITWELYQEPPVLECWVNWYQLSDGYTWASVNTSQELAAQKAAQRGDHIHTEYVRVEVPSSNEAAIVDSLCRTGKETSK